MQFEKAYVEGITKLQSEDIRYAEQLGYRIKLLGITRHRVARRQADRHRAAGAPDADPRQRLIANVEGAMNAVWVKGDAVGHTMYYGKGAGAEPTASAVVADLVDVARMLTADPEQPRAAPRVPGRVALGSADPADRARSRPPTTCACGWPTSRGVLADITRILADARISIDAVLQREPAEGEAQTDIILLTHRTIEKQVDAAIARIEALSTVLSKVIRIRLEDLD